MFFNPQPETFPCPTHLNHMMSSSLSSAVSLIASNSFESGVLGQGNIDNMQDGGMDKGKNK